MTMTVTPTEPPTAASLDPRSAAGAPALSAWPLAALGTAILLYRYVLQIGQPTSWHFFADAATGLFQRNGPGLDLYAVHPEFQFGPLAAVVAALFQPIPGMLIRPAVATFGMLLGLATVLLLERMALELHPGVDPVRLRRALWCAAIPLLYAWGDIAVRSEHIDDAIAVTGIAAAGLLLARRRPWAATALLAIAVAAKPWAIVCVPMLAVGQDRDRLVRPLVAAGAAGATWLPFLLDDRSTLRALSHFTIANSGTSALRVFGVAAARTPSWDRPAQVLLGLGAAALLVRWDRWWAIPMSSLGIRLLLDPGTHRYYTAGLAVAVLMWELCVAPTKVPWRTIVTVVMLGVTTSYSVFGHEAGRVRFAVLLALIALPFWERWRAPATTPAPAPA
jgi:hypothetical protein